MELVVTPASIVLMLQHHLSLVVLRLDFVVLKTLLHSMTAIRTTRFIRAPRRHKSVSDVLTEHVPVVNEHATIGEIENLLSRHAKDFATIIYMYVVDEDRTLKGVVSIREVFLQAPTVLDSTIMTKEPFTVLESDQF